MKCTSLNHKWWKKWTNKCVQQKWKNMNPNMCTTEMEKLTNKLTNAVF